MKPGLPDKLHRLEMLWRRYAPHRIWMGMTVDQFAAKLAHLDAHLDGMKEVDFTYMGMIASRETMAGGARAACIGMSFRYNPPCV